MNLHSKVAVSLLIVSLTIWIFRNFLNKKLSASQVLFWLFLLAGGEILTLLPELVDVISLLWGNLVPVSWITFVGLMTLIAYLIFMSMKVNELQSRLINLSRSVAFFEQRTRTSGLHDGDIP
jgi:hypothetical protein